MKKYYFNLLLTFFGFLFLITSYADIVPSTEVKPCTPFTAEGQICTVQNLGIVHPTQFNVGQHYVNELIKEYINKNPDVYQKFLNNKLFSIVIGPDQILYIPDGHHRLSTTFELANLQKHPYTVYFKIVKHFPTDSSSKAAKEFWAWMAKNNNVWLEDLGQPRDPDYLPPTLKGLTNDKYRTLAGWLEEAKWCYYSQEGENLNFTEFVWADYLRKLDKEGKLIAYQDPDPNTAYGKKQIQVYLNYIESTGICHINEARHLPGYCPSNANCAALKSSHISG